MPVPAVSEPGVSAPGSPGSPEGRQAAPLFRPLPAPPPPWRRALDWALANRHRLVVSRRRLVAIAGAALALGLAVVVVVRAMAVAGPPPEITLPKATPGSTGSGSTGSTGAGGATGAGAAAGGDAEVAVVYVVGAVAHPGIYRLPTSARVGDAVTAAGGAVDGADLDQMNLAAPVADGDKVVVPRPGEGGDSGPDAGSGGAAGTGTGAGGGGSAVVNLNSATVAALDELPGVGPSLAAAIVEYRKQHGRFHAVQDLLEVPGIGPAKLAALRSRVRV